MEVGGKMSLMRMIGVVLLIMGMCLGHISADREAKFEACFEPCYLGCVKQRPNDLYLSKQCIDKCTVSCNKKSSTDRTHRKTLAKQN
ncbi:hypothetical protein MKX01_035522 [Papaver californicum]|nr:hypothetical protein MKX01_035522 [Papaver californicum]